MKDTDKTKDKLIQELARIQKKIADLEEIIIEGKQVKMDLSDMPQHEFIPEGLGDSFKRVLPDVILMIFLIMLFFVGAYVSFLRYDVR